MPVVSITRLRVRSWRFLAPFLVATFRVARQAMKTDGNVRVRLLRDSRNTYWTATAWTSEAAMKAFMHAPPHGPAMRRLLDWCDEASLVHWSDEAATLPDWQEADRRLRAEGRPSKVLHPSADHQRLSFAAPVVRVTGDLRLK